MRILVTVICAICLNLPSIAQTISFENKQYEEAFNLAVTTVDLNTRRGILAAGADYGGEWTRDISINVWNGVGLLRPEVAKKSLWSVSNNKQSIKHEYWDKIIWTIGAFEYYKTTGDVEFMKQAYTCATNTMGELEASIFDEKYGLFMGPSVFNDGIAAYQPPIYDSTKFLSGVVDYPNSKTIKCLSTNSIYLGAYQTLANMSQILEGENAASTKYKLKADQLAAAIKKHLYNTEKNQFYYLIDNEGNIDQSQEALGISFAILFGVIDQEKASDLLKDLHVSPYGITSIYPDFARFSEAHPGRHNNIIWPMINGFFAQAAIQSSNTAIFEKEINGLVSLTLDEDKGDYNFREIFNPYTGKPDGGWQGNGPENPDFHWESCHHQTWSATAYIRMVFNGLAGMNFQPEQITFKPFMPETCTWMEIKNLPYRNSILSISIKGAGKTVKAFYLDGKKQRNSELSSNIKGEHQILIEMN